MTDDLRDRIAKALTKHFDYELDRGADLDLDIAADAVLDALAPQQVGWLGPYGIVPGGMDNEPNERWRPVYIFGAAIDSCSECHGAILGPHYHRDTPDGPEVVVPAEQEADHG